MILTREAIEAVIEMWGCKKYDDDRNVIFTHISKEKIDSVFEEELKRAMGLAVAKNILEKE